MEAQPTEEAAKLDREQALARLKSEAVSCEGKVTGFRILTYVVVAVIGVMGVLWLTAYFVPTLFVGIPVLVSFCTAMNWLFPLCCAIFFASAGSAGIFAISHNKKREEITALEGVKNS